MQLTLYERNGDLQRGDALEVDPAQVIGVSEVVRWRNGEPRPVALVRLADGRTFWVDDPARRLTPAVRQANGLASICRQGD